MIVYILLLTIAIGFLAVLTIAMLIEVRKSRRYLAELRREIAEKQGDDLK